jgi:hypothetical protein
MGWEQGGGGRVRERRGRGEVAVVGVKGRRKIRRVEIGRSFGVIVEWAAGESSSWGW